MHVMPAGAMFHDLLKDYTHWGWFDIDAIVGDLSPLLDACRKYDVVTFPDPVRRVRLTRERHGMALRSECGFHGCYPHCNWMSNDAD